MRVAGDAMTCKCVVPCTQPAVTNGLCEACFEIWDLGGECGLPYVQPVYTPIEPSVPLAPTAVDKAIDKTMEDLIG